MLFRLPMEMVVEPGRRKRKGGESEKSLTEMTSDVHAREHRAKKDRWHMFFVFIFAVVVCAVLALLKSLNSVLLSNIRYQHSEASHIGSGCPLHSLKAWEKRLDVLRLKKGVGCSEKYDSSWDKPAVESHHWSERMEYAKYLFQLSTWFNAIM